MQQKPIFAVTEKGKTMSVCKNCDYYDSCSLPEPNKKCKVNSMNDEEMFKEMKQRAVQKIPDLVEVVRCKDCIHYDIEVSICRKPKWSKSKKPDGFCDEGERKETE